LYWRCAGKKLAKQLKTSQNFLPINARILVHCPHYRLSNAQKSIAIHFYVYYCVYKSCNQLIGG
jgi:hypothetical protein